MTSAHFPFFSPSSIFLDCLKSQDISSLNCSVGLRVVYRCEGDFRPYLVTEILEHGTIKILGIVDGDLLRNSVTTDDVLPEKFLDCGGGYIGYRFRFNPFGEVLPCNDGGVISLYWCKFAHNINMPHRRRGQDGAINCDGCAGALQRWENIWQAS
jgi:hypothetical protein